MAKSFRCGRGQGQGGQGPGDGGRGPWWAGSAAGRHASRGVGRRRSCADHGARAGLSLGGMGWGWGVNGGGSQGPTHASRGQLCLPPRRAPAAPDPDVFSHLPPSPALRPCARLGGCLPVRPAGSSRSSAACPPWRPARTQSRRSATPSWWRGRPRWAAPSTAHRGQQWKCCCARKHACLPGVGAGAYLLCAYSAGMHACLASRVRVSRGVGGRAVGMLGGALAGGGCVRRHVACLPKPALCLPAPGSCCVLRAHCAAP